MVGFVAFVDSALDGLTKTMLSKSVAQRVKCSRHLAAAMLDHPQHSACEQRGRLDLAQARYLGGVAIILSLLRASNQVVDLV